MGGGAYIGGDSEVTSDRRAGGSSSRRMGDCEWECEKGIPVLACVDIVVILCERSRIWASFWRWLCRNYHFWEDATLGAD